MSLTRLESRTADQDGYLFGRREAWFSFAMTIALMIMDYLDRQVIVSLFPHIKADLGWSDAQLGSLVSVVSVTVALGGIPVGLVADRASRVRSIAIMAGVWSLATISCMFTRSYGQLLVARAAVGLGEAGYGSVGAALLSSHFPARMRAAVLACLAASASVGSVLGVVLGALIAAQWGWQAAFGVVGVPGLLLALLYLKVRDYRTVELAPAPRVTSSPRATAIHIAKRLASSRTMRWVCLGAAAQLVVVSAVWAWLPSFFNRMHGMPPERASMLAAAVVLAGACGSVVWGVAVDRSGVRQPRRKLTMMAGLCLASLLLLQAAFGGWLALSGTARLSLIFAGGFVMTCTVGPVAAIVIDVVHPGVRATGASVLSLFQNLFGLAAGPVFAGLISDHWGLQPALATMAFFAIPAAGCFLLAARTYEADAARAGQSHDGEVAPQPLAAAGA